MSVDPSSPFPRHLPGTEIVAFGPFRFDHAERVLTRDGEEVRLPPRVVGILQFLLERQGKVVSKQALIDGVWGGTAVTETSLTEAISLLRQALGDDAQDPRYLETVHRRGYRFRNAVTPAPSGAAGFSPPAGGLKAAAPWIVAAGLVVVAITVVVIAMRGRTPDAPKPTHVTIATIGELMEWSSLAISPNGRDIVYVAKQGEIAMLHHRSLDGFESRVVPETKDVANPFFSPDGEWIGFFAEGKLMKVKLRGGAPITLCRTSRPGGATWTDDGSIIFADAPLGGLSRISADGGAPETLTVPDSMAGEVAHVSPEVLPGGKSVLFTIFSTTVHAARVAVLSLETKQRRVILEHAGGARYVPGGFLVYSSSDGVRVAPFDADEARVGPPIGVLRDVMANPFSGELHLSIANDGTIVYFAGATKETPVRELVRRHADGRIETLPTPQRYYRNLELAPDSTRAAVTILQEDRSDVWMADLRNGTLNRLSFEGFNIEPVWSPDGEWVYYASNRSGPYNVYRRRANGQGPEERLLQSRLHQYPLFWSPDGRILVIAQTNPETSLDIHLLERRADGSWKNRPYVRTPNADLIGEVSPDGRWFAYASYEGNEWNVFVQDFPEGRGKWQMSTGGGWQPFWSSDGAMLYFESPGKLTGVPLTFRVGGVERGREIAIDDAGIALAQRGTAPGELTMIRTQKKPETKRELRMVTGWAASVAAQKTASGPKPPRRTAEWVVAELLDLE